MTHDNIRHFASLTGGDEPSERNKTGVSYLEKGDLGRHKENEADLILVLGLDTFRTCKHNSVLLQHNSP